MSTTAAPDAPNRLSPQPPRRVRVASAAQWKELNAQVGGQLGCAAARGLPGQAPERRVHGLFRSLKNPWYIGDSPALTQTSGWVDAWTSTPSAYAVAGAQRAADVAAAVNFARRHRLRLVVKGGGHSYQGTSERARIRCWSGPARWTHRAARRLRRRRAAAAAPQPAVSVGAGAVWLDAYDAVTPRPAATCRAAAARPWAWPA